MKYESNFDSLKQRQTMFIQSNELRFSSVKHAWDVRIFTQFTERKVIYQFMHRVQAKGPYNMP